MAIIRQIDLKHHVDDFQLGQIDELINRFKTFASANPNVMKQPGVTRGA